MNINKIKKDESLVSINQELIDKWVPKKSLSEPLILSFCRLGLEERAKNVINCGTFLEFAKYQNNDIKLHRANFCRDRLCPLCSWRRSYKIFGQVSQIMNLISDDYEFLFLTLTVRNCTSKDLNNKIDELQKAWRRFSDYKRVKSILKGFFKALEITYNQTADTYHPHYHVVLAVPKGYFNSRDYIQRDDWLDMWRKAMRDYSITQVDIRKAKNKRKDKDGEAASKKLASAVAEIAKYSVKSSDYLFKNDDELTDKVVSVLATALADRRLCNFGGCFSDAHRKLQLDDAEDGDLIHVDGQLRSDVALQIYRFGWSAGAYKLISVENKS